MFDPAGAWRQNFLRWLNDSRSEFYVNLRGMDAYGGPNEAVRRGASGSGGATDWEMSQLVDHADDQPDGGAEFWPRVHFYGDNGAPTANPFN